MRTNLVIIEGAKFIYDTNFSGDQKETVLETIREKQILSFRTLSRQEG